MPRDIDSIFASDDWLAASLAARAMSHARSASQRSSCDPQLFGLMDLFHNVGFWFIHPASLPAGATSALEAVLRGARTPELRAWLVDQLVIRGREDVIARLDLLHVDSDHERAPESAEELRYP